MIAELLDIDNYIKTFLNYTPNNTINLDFCVFDLKQCLMINNAVKLNFHLIILCKKGECDAIIGHHEFKIKSKTISIIPPNTISSLREFSDNFEGGFLLFKSDFLKKGFVQSNIMDELLFINPDYPPTFNLNKTDFKDTLYKFSKIKEETEKQSPFCIEVSRLYILQILYDYNRICEICLLNSDKLINRQYQVVYEFKKLIDQNFLEIKTVKEYANIMCLSSKYISECVKNQTGKSAISLIQNRILIEAELLLNYSNLSIKNISDKLGFNSTSSFTRFFKSLNKISPIHFKNKLKNG